MCKDKQAFIRTLSTRFILNGGVLMRYNVEKKMTWPWIKIIVSKRQDNMKFQTLFVIKIYASQTKMLSNAPKRRMATVTAN
ncbi:hypothetical protein YC2023_117423 [Brassica napus]